MSRFAQIAIMRRPPPKKPSGCWDGKSFLEIAQIRGRQVASVVNMVADLVEKGRLKYRIEWVGEDNHQLVAESIARLGSERLFRPNALVTPALIVCGAHCVPFHASTCPDCGAVSLKPLHEALPPEITYDQIRLAVAFVRRQNAAAS